MHHRKAYVSAFYLLTLAKNQVSYDFFTSKCLWGLSNYLVLGEVRVENFGAWPRQSNAARDLRTRSRSIEEWRRGVRFEHCRPLNASYGLILQQADQLGVIDLLGIIGEYPPVIITREEDEIITNAGCRNSGEPADRYAHIPVDFPLRATLEPSTIERVINASRVVNWPDRDAGDAPINA